MTFETRVSVPQSIGVYTFKGIIGQGAFSVILLAHDNSKHLDCACKVVRRSRLNTPSLQHQFEAEVRIFEQMSHDRIVRLFDLMKDHQNYYIFMEYCTNGELFKLIVDHGHLNESQSRFIIREILDALAYCHSRGVAHRDLKPENILVSATGHIKLSDFGMSKYVGTSGLCNTSCGTPAYASPECLTGGPCNAMASDVWSVGVILFALVTGMLPWTQTVRGKLFDQIKAGQYRIPPDVSPACADLIRRLMTVDPAARITIQEAHQHPWMLMEPRPRCRQDDVPRPFVGVKKADRLFEDDDAMPSEEATNGVGVTKSGSMQPGQFDAVARSLKIELTACASVPRTKLIPALMPPGRSGQIRRGTNVMASDSTPTRAPRRVPTGEAPLRRK
jgi:serine/threonine protein kinase